MSIKFSVVGGPLDGKTFEYGIGKPSITIGRYPDCDIVFPKEMIAISRAHLTIVRENARYLLRPDETVFVNGESAERDDPLPHEGELTLGKQGGQKIRFAWSEPADMPTSEFRPRLSDRNPAREARRAVELAQTSSRRFVMLAIGVAVLVVGAIAAFFLTREDPIEAKVGPLRQSVYLVMTRTADGYERAGGTAWVIAPGVLATNAHVVAGIVKETKKDGIKAVVRANYPPYETHDIIETVSHPHFERFTNLMYQYVPVAPGGRLVQSTTGYDVGLIRVAATAKLAPPLKVASKDTLHHLAAGDEVGYIGYPSERMVAGGVNVAEPTPQIHIATITAVTDFFLSAGEPGDRHLIQHSLPGAGGASGSPIFNRRGEVIALFNAANLVTIGETRIPNILVNFAQRADLVGEILDVKVDTIALARDEAWKKRLAGLPSAPVYLAEQFQRDTDTKASKPLLDTTVTLEKKPNVNKPAALVDFEIPGPGKIIYLAFGEYPHAVHLYVLDPANNNRVLGRKTDNIHYPWIRLDTGPARACWYRKSCPNKVTIAVLGDNVGQKITLKVFFAPPKKS